MTTKNQKTQRKHFVQALYKTLEGVVSPTPYLEISDGEQVEVNFLNGKGNLPRENVTEINVLDIDIASLFFDDFHILYEGVTGVGKTYTSDALFNTIFGENGHYTLRLSGGILGGSALEPFTTATLENGIPKTKIDHDKCSRYGALFIDEINRGDNNEVFQIVDGVVYLNGDTGYLRIPIPNTDRHKNLAIIAAMNPADAEHSAVSELDIAGENRFLKFNFPNGVAEAGSGQLEKRVQKDLYNTFWQEFSRTSGQTGDWRETYPVITDPTNLETGSTGNIREFIDIALGYVGYDPKETVARNNALLRQGDLSSNLVVTEDNNYQKVIETQGSLKHSFVRRDLGKIENLSRLFGFITGIKNGSYEIDTTLTNAAAAIGTVLESKRVTGAVYGNLMALVNDARSSYSKFHTDFQIPKSFGIRQGIWQAAVYAGQDAEKGKQFEAYRNTIQGAISKINVQGGGIADITLRSRLAADLAVLDYFSRSYEKDIETALKKKGQNAFKSFGALYQAKKSRSSVYEHRLDSILGGI